MNRKRPNPPIKSFRDLIVWQRAKQLASASKLLVEVLPPEGDRLLADQLLRASISVMANIAEGRGRLSKADNVRHLAIARGSLNEYLSHVEAACDLGFVSLESTTNVRELADEVGKMLNAQIRVLGNRRLD